MNRKILYALGSTVIFSQCSNYINEKNITEDDILKFYDEHKSEVSGKMKDFFISSLAETAGEYIPDKINNGIAHLSMHDLDLFLKFCNTLKFIENNTHAYLFKLLNKLGHHKIKTQDYIKKWIDIASAMKEDERLEKFIELFTDFDVHNLDSLKNFTDTDSILFGEFAELFQLKQKIFLLIIIFQCIITQWNATIFQKMLEG